MCGCAETGGSCVLTEGECVLLSPIALGTKKQSRTELSAQGTLTSSQACASLCCDHSGQGLPYKELYLWLPQAGSFSPDHLALVPGGLSLLPLPRRSSRQKSLEKAALVSLDEQGSCWEGLVGVSGH